jgi:hypothetical protein
MQILNQIVKVEFVVVRKQSGLLMFHAGTCRFFIRTCGETSKLRYRRRFLMTHLVYGLLHLDRARIDEMPT